MARAVMAGAAALFVTVASPAAAQNCGAPPAGEDGVNTICGYVYDQTGTGVSGVTVNIGANTVTTGLDGFYAISVGPDTYSVSVDTMSPPLGSGWTASPGSTVVTLTLAQPVRSGVNFVVSSGVQEPVPMPCDFITSGGFVMNNSNKKVSFGAHGGCKNGEFWGQVNVVDHATGYHMNSDEITGYVAPFGTSDPTRDICGWLTTNKTGDPERVRFRVRLTDKGEPGSLDLFGIVLGPGVVTPYLVTPRLLSAAKPGGGNVQLHLPNPSTTAPSPLPANMCGGLTFSGGGTPPD
jgi:hypothetical protein